MLKLAKWEENISAFHAGGNGCEYIAWKGSHQILVYPCHEYPGPPTEIIQHDKRIESLKEFYKAWTSGKRMKAEYTEI